MKGNPYKSPQQPTGDADGDVQAPVPDSESRSVTTAEFAVRAALYLHITITVNFVIYGMLVFIWTGFGWETNPVFAVYAECSNLLANQSFLFMPAVLLLLVICLPLSWSAGKRAGIVLASLGLNLMLVIMVVLLMATPDFGL